MRGKILYLFLVLSLFSFHVFSQDTAYLKKHIINLSSEKFLGRGYVNKGVNKAAKYLAKEMQNIGLKNFNKSYFQKLDYSVNTFPGKISLEIDGKKLINGEDFFIGPASPKINQEYEIVNFDSITLADTIRFMAKAVSLKLSDKLVVIDFSVLTDSDVRWFYIHLMRHNYINAGGYIELNDGNLAWAVRNYQQNIPSLKIKKSSWNTNYNKVKLKLKPKFIEKYNTENVIGYIEGEKDEYIVICGHYDHLGSMGNKVFTPGANDNASGTSAVLDFARYYAKNKPKYNILFACFTGEEAGLRGSTYFADNPLIPLDKIKLVVNFDMIGTGEEGATIVNGAVEAYADITNKFLEINERNKYLNTLNLRGEARNSDHYPFHAKGVKAVFFYTMGAETYYHSPKDVIDNMSFAGYEGLFKLVRDFIAEYE
ncbi:MAG: M28 family peptidase [Bacteroidales bacterium]|nr:M28 family peptidase [Bacteroidales bacterium]